MALENWVQDWFYTYRPLGKNKVPIKASKLKTMYNGSDKHLSEVKKANGLNELGKPNNDPRIIPSRRFFRKYFLDELPQLLNIFIFGNMKVVGIRPRSEESWEDYPIEHKEKALEQKPGLASVAYANGDDVLTAEQKYLALKGSRLRIDINYGLNIAYQIVMKRKRSE